MENLKEMLKESSNSNELEKYAERYGRTIFDFNKTLRGGRVKPIDAYRWLQEKKQRDEAEFEREHGFRMNMDYLYIYPEVFGPMPDTFEEWKNQLQTRER